MSVSMTDAQFEALLSKLSPGRHGSFTSCKAEFDGTKDSEATEAFLAAVSVFKKIENVTDAEALTGLPLLLKGEAAVWWQGVKNHVSTWADFEERLRHTFAPKKPAYVLYQEIVMEKQDYRMTTESFVAHKRMLFAQLPQPEIPESHQLHMIYGQLKHRIRDKIPRNSIKTYDELLETARGIEQMWIDRSNDGDERRDAKSKPNPKVKVKCGFCHFSSHTTEQCRKLKKKQQELDLAGPNKNPEVPPKTMAPSKPSQDPSPPVPRVSCYGCGTPGVVRSSCPTCSATKQRPLQSANLGFCPVNVQSDVRSRPIVFIEIDGIKGTAYVDTCAKTSIASYQLYRQLTSKGHKFHEEIVKVTLADGMGKKQRVLKTTVPVKLEDRTIITSFVVLPDSRDNRTLLGVGFIQDARMLINLAQFTWEFLEAQSTYELYEEDFVIFDQASGSLMNSSLDATGENASTSSMASAPSNADVLPEVPTTAIACTSAAALPESASTYKLIPLELSPAKKRKRVFDGYLPAFAEFMMQDAEKNVTEAEVNLSPHSSQLFPGASGPTDFDDDYHAYSIDIDDKHKDTLNKILVEYQDVFTDNNQPSLLGEHCIVTKNDIPISVPPYRLSQTNREILKTELHEMLEKAIIEPCSSPWASPVVMVPKPNGKVRVCVDYRRPRLKTPDGCH